MNLGIGMEVGMVPFNVTPSDLVGKILLSDFMTFFLTVTKGHLY